MPEFERSHLYKKCRPLGLRPAGILLGAGFIHAGFDLIAPARRWILPAAYGWGALVGAAGLSAPELFYAPGLTAPGPLFWPVAAISAAGTLATVLWLVLEARAARGLERRRRWSLAVGSVFGSLGGGGAVAAQVLGGAHVRWSAPFLLVATALVSYAVLRGERGRARRLVQQSLVYALMTAALSSVGLVVFFHLLPHLAPASGQSWWWLVVVTFFAALPLDALRTLVVERSARHLFRDPIGVADLAERVEASEVRVDQAERLAALGTMVSAVAHEIRNPLGVIAAQAKLLERRGASPKSVEALRQQVERARRFVDDLLRYGKPRPLDIGEVRVAAALAKVVREIEGNEARRIEVALGDAEDVDIQADAGAFHDVFTVLLDNAIVAIHGQADAHIEVTAGVEAGDLRVTVEDNGPGVPAAIEARLFEPFVSGRDRDSPHPGTGLGRVIARRWLERHGGTLHYQRRAEGGARFVVRWPHEVAAHG